MNEIEIRRPQIDDVEELNQFFRIVVEDTFAKEGISDLLDDQESEIESLESRLRQQREEPALFYRFRSTSE